MNIEEQYNGRFITRVVNIEPTSVSDYFIMKEYARNLIKTLEEQKNQYKRDAVYAEIKRVNKWIKQITNN